MGSVVASESARMPDHHLDDALLLDYAAGVCGEAEGLAVATHLTLCPSCRARSAELDCVGGALLEELPPVDLAPDSFDRLMARLNDPEPAREDTARSARGEISRKSGSAAILVPAPLLRYLSDGMASDLDGLDWHSVTRGIDEVAVPTDGGLGKAKLLRIRAGTKVPSHTHRGSEITVVLAGGFTDSRGHFLRGDVAVSDQEVDHSPVADAEGDCICLVVTDAPLKLTGRIGRFLNPFVKF
jgi:putative transcriptional regulator